MTVEEIYRNTAPKLTNWLVATGSPYEEACDLVQQAFMKIWERRDTLRDCDSAVSGLAFTIAKNLRKNLRRDESRMTDIEDVGEDALGAVGPEPSPSDAQWLRKKLSEAFNALPPLLREAYTLFQIGELSIREISMQTGASENLVKVRIHRAKQKLQVLLADVRKTYNP